MNNFKKITIICFIALLTSCGFKPLLSNKESSFTIKKIDYSGEERLNYLIINKLETYKNLKKGLSMPTCISVNETVCHYAPIENDNYQLKEGDLIRFEVAAHIDNCNVTLGDTLEISTNNFDDIKAEFPDKIKENRGRGLLTAFEMHDSPHLDGHTVSVGLLNRGVYAKETHHSTVRVAPALTIQAWQIDNIAEAIRDVIKSL